MTPPLLHGASVDLHPVTEADLSALLAWYNAPDIFKYMGRETHLTMADQHAWLSISRSDPGMLVWAVYRRDTASLIGSITLRNLMDRAKRAELGVLPGISGSGFGSDAVHTVLAHASAGLTSSALVLRSAATTVGQSPLRCGLGSGPKAFSADAS